MCDKTRKNKVRNENIHRQVEITTKEKKLRENCLQCFGHIRCRSRNVHVRRMKKIDIARSKKVEETKNDMDESNKKLYEIIRN